MAGEGTGPVIPIKGSYQANPAFVEATRDLRQWSGEVKANIDTAKQSVAGIKESVEFATQALKGFGLVGIARDALGFAQSIGTAALGIGDFIMSAQEAGATVDAELVAKAQSLQSEIEETKRVILEVGAILVGPFVDDVRTAVDSVRAYFEENIEGFRRLAQAGKEAVDQFKAGKAPNNMLDALGMGAGAVGAMAADTAVGGASVSEEERKRRQMASRLGDLTPEDLKVQDEMIREGLAEQEREQARAARDQQRKEAQLQREREHAERLRLQQQAEYDRDFQSQLLKEQQEDLRKTERAQQAMIQYAHTEQEKLQAVQMWQDQQLALVQGHQDAETRIVAEAERRRAEVTKSFRDQESKQRQQQHKQNLDNTKQTLQAGIGLLGAAFGQSKGVRIAEALVNTYTGVSAALAKGPAGIPMAAIIAAQGFAQVANIKSTNPGAGGGGGSLGFSSPSFSPPSSIAPAPTSSPLAPTASPVTNKIEVSVAIKGSLLTEEKISQGVMDAIEIASRDGRTSIVTRKD